MKYDKDQVEFEHPARGMDKCSQCVHYLSGFCAIVAGTIRPNDWCNKYQEDSDMKSAADIINEQSKPVQKRAKAAAGRTIEPQTGIKEHGLKITSRTTGRVVDVGFGPQGGGLVPKNPFASLAQEGYLHAHPEKLGPEKLAEFDSATKGKKLPKRVKKGK